MTTKPLWIQQVEEFGRDRLQLIADSNLPISDSVGRLLDEYDKAINYILQTRKSTVTPPPTDHTRSYFNKLKY